MKFLNVEIPVKNLPVLDEGFIPRLLDYLMEHSLADQPLSLEKRGLLLHDFIATHYPAFATQASVERGRRLLC